MLVALALNGVPIDVLAERLGSTRGALYKTLHDARRKLRAALAGRGLSSTDRRRDDHEPTRTDDHGRCARCSAPPGPSSTCEECFEQLDRYVELELAGARRRRGDARACARTSRAARPAARTTTACARSSTDTAG